MQIIISHVYSSQNRGDAALTCVLINDIKKTFPDAKITILTREGTTQTQNFEGVPQKPSWMFLILGTNRSQFSKLLKAVCILTVTSLWSVFYRYTHKQLWLPAQLRLSLQTYLVADLIIPVGGGYLRSTARSGLISLVNLTLLLHPLVIGRLLGKPTALYTQSIGPFNNWFEEKMVAAALKRQNLILVREDISLKLLQRMGVTANVRRSVDSGFLLPPASQTINLRQLYKIPATDLVVGITVRKWFRGRAQQKYEQAVAEALDHLLAKHHTSLIFIPQVTSTDLHDDDRQASQAVYRRLRSNAKAHVITTEYDHHQIKSLYAELDLLIGTRFHSVIFALTSYVPAVAIEYEHKTSGIMQELGLEQWLLSINNLDAKELIKKIDQLISQRQAYRQHLTKILPAYIKQAETSIELVQQACWPITALVEAPATE